MEEDVEKNTKMFNQYDMRNQLAYYGIYFPKEFQLDPEKFEDMLLEA